MFYENLAIFYVFFAIALFLEIAFISNTKDDINKRNKKVVNIVLMVLLILIAGLRSPNTGSDTASYYGRYRFFLYGNSKNIDFYFDSIIDAFKTGNFSDGMMWDFSNKVLTLVLRHPQIWLGFISAFYILCAYITISRYSNEPVISWIYLVCIYVFLFVLLGLRQSIAMAFVLLSIKYVYEKNLKLFLLFIFLAYLFHQSAIAFVIVYPLRKTKVSARHLLAIVASFLIINVFPTIFSDILKFFASNSRFENYLSRSDMYTLSGAYVLTAIYLLCYYFKKELIEEDERNQLLFTISLIAIVIQICSLLVAEMFRVSLYFSTFNMILVSNTMCIIDKKVEGRKNKIESNTYRVLLVLAFATYFTISSSYFKYFFFWQG